MKELKIGMRFLLYVYVSCMIIGGVLYYVKFADWWGYVCMLVLITYFIKGQWNLWKEEYEE